MKKLLIVLLALLLMACNQAPKKVVKKVVKEVPIVVEEEIEYIETDQLKDLVKLSNQKTKIVDIQILHDQLSVVLLDQVDLNTSLDQQADLIEEIIIDELYKWKQGLVMEVLAENSIQLNEDDLLTVIDRVSVRDAYNVMLAYETVFLRREAE